MEQMQMMETDEGTYAEEKGRGGAGGGEGESSVISSNPLEGEPKRRKGELQMSRSRTDG
jgi:hypothetical protein